LKASGPKILLHVEGFVVLFAASTLYRDEGGSWVTFAALFFVPDLLMAGYVFGAKAGSWIYNAGHTYTGPFLVWIVLSCAHRASLLPLDLIWVAHIGFDRFLGVRIEVHDRLQGHSSGPVMNPQCDCPPKFANLARLLQRMCNPRFVASY
jgi:hypothetical protein